MGTIPPKFVSVNPWSQEMWSRFHHFLASAQNYLSPLGWNPKLDDGENSPSFLQDLRDLLIDHGDGEMENSQGACESPSEKREPFRCRAGLHPQEHL